MAFPPQRQGQPRLLLPPLPQVDDQLQPLVAVGELSLVDDQAGIHVAAGHNVEDVVERMHDIVERPSVAGLVSGAW